MFDKFQDVGKQNILVIGDIILDKYIHGKTDRISPEAPVPVVNVVKESHILGGAANVAANLKTLGANITLVGQIGNDKNGVIVKELVQEHLENSVDLLISESTTTTKTRIVAKNQQLLRIDDENTDFLIQEDEDTLLSKTRTLLKTKTFTGVILQDYNKGIFSKRVIHEIIQTANSEHIPVFVDPKHNNFWEYKNVSIFKPNHSELINANKNNEINTLEELLLTTYEKLKCKMLFCTLAERGNAFVQNNQVTIVPTKKIGVVDVSGAGDSSLAIIVLTYLLGYHASEIAILANICGKVACMKKGVSTVSLTDIKQAYSDHTKES